MARKTAHSKTINQKGRQEPQLMVWDGKKNVIGHPHISIDDKFERVLRLFVPHSRKMK